MGWLRDVPKQIASRFDPLRKQGGIEGMSWKERMQMVRALRELRDPDQSVRGRRASEMVAAFVLRAGQSTAYGLATVGAVTGVAAALGYPAAHVASAVTEIAAPFVAVAGTSAAIHRSHRIAEGEPLSQGPTTPWPETMVKIEEAFTELLLGGFDALPRAAAYGVLAAIVEATLQQDPSLQAVKTGAWAMLTGASLGSLRAMMRMHVGQILRGQ